MDVKDRIYITEENTLTNIDIEAAFGIRITKDSYSKLFAFPKRKEPPHNDWQDEDGIDVDLSEVVFEPRNITLSFAAGKNADLDGFFELLMSPGYKIFVFNFFQMELKLRYKAEQERKIYKAGDTFAVQFIDDFPLQMMEIDEVYLASEDGYFIITEDEEMFIDLIPEYFANINIPIQPQYDINSANTIVENGLHLKRFGIGVEKWSKDSFIQNPALKEQLTITSKHWDGQKYNVDIVKRDSQKATLSCCMVTNTRLELMMAYGYFFSFIVENGLLNLTVSGKTYTCYYQSMGDVKLYYDNSIFALRFGLNFVLLNE